jgi:hypothetical protein
VLRGGFVWSLRSRASICDECTRYQRVGARIQPQLTTKVDDIGMLRRGPISSFDAMQDFGKSDASAVNQ